MKVILLRDVKNVGRKFEVKEVNDGFGRNMLINKGFALAATPDNISKIKGDIDRVQNATAKRQEMAHNGLKALDGVSITITGKANPEGHLFAQVHKIDIIKALQEQEFVTIEQGWIVLDTPIKTVGEHLVTLKIGDQKAVFKVVVTSIK